MARSGDEMQKEMTRYGWGRCGLVTLAAHLLAVAAL